MKNKLEKVVQPEGNYYDKYHSSNPLVKWMMSGFKNKMKIMLYETKKNFNHVCEAGCGEGEITTYIRSLYNETEIDAFDISRKVIEEANRKNKNVSFFVGDICNLRLTPYSAVALGRQGGGTYVPQNEFYDLIVCLEVLEHLERPEAAIENFKKINSHDGYLLLSVPNEPIWRICNMARGKYLSDFGNTPGHINHWSKRSFCKMLKKCGLEIISVESPFPWTMVLAKKG